ncbi:amino acid aldolase [Trypanosoma rangeli]|uniref:Amino acid aldolase n=1 Tax=Trypanosoma rangeli TaxID=5698 RepID=A0A422NZK8_TRYRA|nr:amino acid aldolase [Trypanosoma rangeli]RNF10898.1 amino acid aldolase [Trypanosoma rangeli]|eukprot:RNF10898.1 amino acid aldolase [Trypanosoma rangeli]
MGLFGRVSFLVIAFLSAAYSAYALSEYRAAWCISRARIIIPKAVRRFHASLKRNGLARNCSHSPDKRTAKDADKPVAVQPGAAAKFSTSAGWSAETGALSGSLSCPVAFVDNAAFESNVHAVVSLLLESKKQIRLSTKGVHCPELLERAAALMERFSHPCSDYDIIAPGRLLVSGLLISNAAEALLWARRGTFPSLLLGEPVVDAVSAANYVEAMTLNATSKLRCLVVVDAVAQLELLWNAAKEWIFNGGYTRLGFDSAVESLQFDLMLRGNLSDDAPWSPSPCGKGSQPLRGSCHVSQLCDMVKEFNAKVSSEKLPVGIQFVIRGLWTHEDGLLSGTDMAPTPSHTTSCFIPARWCMRYPPLRWYKRHAAKQIQLRRCSMLEQLGYKKRPPPDEFLTSGGSSASLAYAAQDETLAEVCVAAGLLCGHHMDRYANSIFKPSLYFALAVTRVRPKRVLICSGFGHSLFGAVAVYPPQLRSTQCHGTHVDEDLEMGVMLSDGTSAEYFIGIGDPVVFRPKYSSTLLELVDSLLLITEEGEVSASMRTYRGEGWNIWA